MVDLPEAHVDDHKEEELTHVFEEAEDLSEVHHEDITEPEAAHVEKHVKAVDHTPEDAFETTTVTAAVTAEPKEDETLTETVEHHDSDDSGDKEDTKLVEEKPAQSEEAPDGEDSDITDADSKEANEADDSFDEQEFMN